MKTQADREALELMIDRCGLPHVVEMLAEVVAEKADHIATAWQDHTLAEVWGDAYEELDGIAASLAQAGI